MAENPTSSLDKEDITQLAAFFDLLARFDAKDKEAENNKQDKAK